MAYAASAASIMHFCAMDWDSVIFNSCAFVAGIFLLQTGAHLFTVNAANIARRYGLPETLIALLTTGAEWEELAVVVVSIIQHRPSLGLGNVVGSCISNIMGAFALGLLFNRNPIRFDLSAKIYSGALFAVSTIFTLLAFTQLLNLTGGIFSIVGFAVYVVSICSAIYDGILAPEPEVVLADDVEDLRMVISPTPSTDHQQLHVSIYPSVLQCHPTEASPLLQNCVGSSPAPTAAEPQPTRTIFHLLLVLIGIGALCVAAGAIGHAASSLATSFQISNMLIGVTLVSISTTLPEKVLSVICSWQSHTAIMTASTAGSNIFLLTLCIGIIFVTGSQDVDDGAGAGAGNELLTDNLVAFEVWSVWGCSVFLVLVTWIGARRWLGALLFGLYIAFVGVELTYFKR